MYIICMYMYMYLSCINRYEGKYTELICVWEHHSFIYDNGIKTQYLGQQMYLGMYIYIDFTFWTYS